MLTHIKINKTKWINWRNQNIRKQMLSKFLREAKEMQSISSIEKERQTKVEELKAQVQNGTYTPQPNQIAKSMIDYYRK